MDQKGDDWLSIVNSDAVVQILEDSKANKDLVAIATEDQINAILNSFRTNNSTASAHAENRLISLIAAPA